MALFENEDRKHRRNPDVSASLSFHGEPSVLDHTASSIAQLLSSGHPAICALDSKRSLLHLIALPFYIDSLDVP